MKYLIIIAVLLSSAVISSCSKEQTQNPAPAEERKSDIQIVREKIQKNPKDVDSLFYLSELYERAKLYQEQYDTLKQVVALQPARGYAYFNMGTALNRLGRYEQAVQSFRKAAKYVPKQPMVYNNMAYAYGKLGKTNDEIGAFKKALALRPSYSIARFNLGMAYLKKGDIAAAQKEYQTLNNSDEGLAADLKKELDAARN